MRIINSIKISSLLFLLALLSVFLLAGCQSPVAFSPEQAAMQNAIDYDLGNDYTVDPNSVRVMQSQRLQDLALVLVSFQGNRQGTRMQCLFHFETHRFPIGTWVSGSGGGSCSVVGQEQTSLKVGMGKSMNSQPGRLGYTEVDGFVKQEDIQTIKVTWQDGETQQAEVINGTYLAARAGSQEIEKIEGLDASGQVIYTHIPPEPPPGKSP